MSTLTEVELDFYMHVIETVFNEQEMQDYNMTRSSIKDANVEIIERFLSNLGDCSKNLSIVHMLYNVIAKTVSGGGWKGALRTLGKEVYKWFNEATSKKNTEGFFNVQYRACYSVTVGTFRREYIEYMMTN